MSIVAISHDAVLGGMARVERVDVWAPSMTWRSLSQAELGSRPKPT